MKPIFSTAGLHARDRFDYWHDVAGRVLTGHDSSPGRRDRFDAELRAAELADIGVFAFQNGSMSCERARKHIANSSTDEFFLCRNGSGRFELEQNGQRNIFLPQDMVLIDSNQRYSVRFSDEPEMIMLKIPRGILEARFGHMGAFLGTKLTAETGLCGHLSMTMAEVCRNVDQFDEAASEAVRNHLVDMLTLLFGAMRVDGERPSTPRSLALLRLRNVIEARLADPLLDSVSAARAAGVSVRYANSLLEAEGTSVARLIRDSRLARCRQALSDPSQDHRTVSEIAFAWGFTNSSHFGRLFSASHGVTPRRFRQSRPDGGGRIPADEPPLGL